MSKVSVITKKRTADRASKTWANLILKPMAAYEIQWTGARFVLEPVKVAPPGFYLNHSFYLGRGLPDGEMIQIQDFKNDGDAYRLQGIIQRMHERGQARRWAS